MQVVAKRPPKAKAPRNPMTALKSPPAPKATGIEARCAATGMRMTEQRRVIARVLAEASDHPDVEELYRRCVAVDDKISISTVYRTVKLFEDAGIIERHDFREGRARYEQMRDSHHDHLAVAQIDQMIVVAVAHLFIACAALAKIVPFDDAGILEQFYGAVDGRNRDLVVDGDAAAIQFFHVGMIDRIRQH